MSEIISEEEVFKGPRFNVVRKHIITSEGNKEVRDIVNPGDASVILPINENNEVVFVCQLRESVGKICIELPAGMVDPGEDPKDTAKRELEEETGIIANNIEYLTTMYPSTGYTSEKVHIYLATDFEEGHVHLDEGEEIVEIKKIPFEKCLEKAINGELTNASQIIAILLYAQKYLK